MNLKDFKNKKVTIFGLGLHGGGIGAAKFFSRVGAKVLATDLRSKQELKESLNQLEGYPIQYVLGQHRPENFINTDLIIKNPAVPDKSKYLQIAKEHKIPIDTDIGIFFEFCPGKIIGVSGTKGKSTTSTLIARFLKQKYSDVVLAGNIKTSALDVLDSIKKNTLVVLELSSWQLAGLRSRRKSPHCAILTNILPDHLNRYPNMEKYIEDKKEIFNYQTKKDFLIVNFDDKILRKISEKTKKPQLLYFTQENGFMTKCGNNGCRGQIGAYAKRDKIFFNKNEICSFEDIKLKGQHNIDNILAAITASKIYNIPDKSIKKVLIKFKGITGRLELIKTINHIDYINDTAATIPAATLAALNSFPAKKNIILIAGGADKNLEFSHLARQIIKKVKILILLEGSATGKIQQSIEQELKTNNLKLDIIGPIDSMQKAVFEAKTAAQKNDIVLLSPACASFGLFQHEFDRGDKFIQAVENL